MSNNDELKWMTERYSWRYIPFRYQALVASVTAAFLYFNIFTVLFRSENGAGGACGSLLRPVTEDGDVGWFTFSIFSRDDSLNCSRYMQVRWWEFFATFLALAICGLVLRRSIKREASSSIDGSAPGNTSPGWKDDPFNSFKQRWWNGSSWTDQSQYKPGMEPKGE